ncbi:endonuclease [Rhodococcus tukisamuensis]|uniref:Endonuclease III n=1 Tax=Rhodococcus tukisamuensis TaxID=168276 RepID=A0A1G6YVB4_9NOCA|nr:endonuclease [Rhodococcus tukisamuensis]SDD94241.1 hypothetical protein SAMN05444580_1084 [Rhodococcus tukisamuensis]
MTHTPRHTGTHDSRALAARLLREAGTTYADEAGISMANKPMPLFELVTLALLLSTRISATIAVRAATELIHTGLRTAASVHAANRGTVIEALGRAHYRRYDESTATRLHAAAERTLEVYGGDLRRLESRCDNDTGVAAALLEEFDGIGPVGAAIFMREVQDVWPWARPYLDDRARTAARALGLPSDPTALAGLTDTRAFAPMAAALVRVSLDDNLRGRLLDWVD